MADPKTLTYPEGVIRPNDSGNLTYHRSIQEIELVELIGEGEIQGFVSGDYNFQDGYPGRTGWGSYSFTPYNDGPLSNGVSNSGVLRSIFYNDIPVLDNSDLYNFTNIDFAYTPGTALGITGVGTQSLINSELKITKLINEAIYGPNYSYDTAGFIVESQWTSRIDDGIYSNRLRGDYESLSIEKQRTNKKVYRINNRYCIGAEINLKVNQLFLTFLYDREYYGSKFPFYADFLIEVRPIFSTGYDESPLIEREIDLYGQVLSPYIHTEKIEFLDYSQNENFLGWEITIIRKTADSVGPYFNISTEIDSITEFYIQNYRYPHSCIVSNKFRADNFASIPNRKYLIDGKKIKIPDNYDPISKNYSGEWNGTFSPIKQWSNNPAWVFYDICTNERYGLGKYIPQESVDIWSLYEIGQYCDELVHNGYGDYTLSGLEPRFECNVTFNQISEAYDLIKDLSSIFRGMVYYGGDQIFVSQDSPKDPILTFTNSNVIDGNFTYSSSAKKSRFSTCSVKYNDKYDFYRPSVEYIEDQESVKRYGIRSRDLIAIGTTSRGQAYRMGKWFLTTQREQTEIVNFGAGLDSSYLRPGDIIKIYDENKTKRRYTGRTLSTKIYSNPSGAEILLDRKLNISNDLNYVFSLLTPSYNYDSTTVDFGQYLSESDIKDIRRSFLQSVYFNGGNVENISGLTKITFTGDSYTGSDLGIFNTGDYSISNNLIWTVENSGESADCEYDLYQILTMEEGDNQVNNITAVEYFTGKFNEIETGLSFGAYTSYVSKTPETPRITSVIIKEENYYTQVSIIIEVNTNDSIVSYMRFNANDRDAAVFNISPGSLPPDGERTQEIGAVGKNHVKFYFELIHGGYYDFTFYGVKNGQKSINNATYSRDKNNGNPLSVNESLLVNNSIIISNFKIEDNVNNLGGTRDTNAYVESSPSLSWSSQLVSTRNYRFARGYFLPAEYHELTRSKIRMSFYREGVDIKTTNPIEFILLSFAQKEYELSLELNSNLIDGPYRNLDITIEAANPNGVSYSNNYSIAAAYDILEIRNPYPDKISNLDSYLITANANGVRLDMSNKTLVPSEDRYGGICVFTLNESFDSNDIQQGTKPIKINYRKFDDKFNIPSFIDFYDEFGSVDRTVGAVLLDEFDVDFIEFYGTKTDNRRRLLRDTYIKNKVAISDRLSTTNVTI